MTRLPSVQDMGGRRAPQPGTGVAAYGTGSEEGTGAIIAQTGNQMVRTADQLHQFAREEKKKADTLRAEDAFNTLRNKQLELTYDEKKGFANRKGADAVNAPLFDEYSKQLQSSIGEIESQLANPEQKAFFRQRANISSLQFGENILRHVAAERSTYATTVFDSTVKTEARAAAAQWNDRTAVDTSVLRVTAAANKYADDKGLPKTGTEEELAPRKAIVEAAQSTVHGGVLGQMLATGEYVKAAEYFKENRDAIDPALAKSVQKAVEDGVQKQQLAGYNRFFTDNMENPAALKTLQKTIDKDPLLDPLRKEALYGRIATRLDLIGRRQLAEQEKAEKAVQKRLDETTTMILSGFEPSVDQLSGLINATKGSTLAPQVQGIVQMANATRSFRLADPVQQAQMQAELAARVRTSPTPESVKILNAFEKIATNQRREVKEDPVGFAVRQGLADPVRIDLTNPGASAGELNAQVATARGVSARYGVPLQPLQPDQVATIQSTLQAQKPAEQINYFGQLRTALGADSQAYTAVMGQIAKDNPVLAVAGDYSARGRTKAAADILRGYQILQPNKGEDGKPSGGKLWPMPKGKDEQTMSTLFVDYTSGALKDPAHRSAIEQTAKAIYAAKIVDAGDDSGTLNTDLWKDAIKEATGGIEKYRGQKTVMPYGMGLDDFRNGLYRQINDIALSGRLGKTVTADRIKDLPVDAIGDGRYVFRTGDGVLVDKGGNPIVVNFNAGGPEIPTTAPRKRIDSLKGAKAPWEKP